VEPAVPGPGPPLLTAPRAAGPIGLSAPAARSAPTVGARMITHGDSPVSGSLTPVAFLSRRDAGPARPHGCAMRRSARVRPLVVTRGAGRSRHAEDAVRRACHALRAFTL